MITVDLGVEGVESLITVSRFFEFLLQLKVIAVMMTFDVNYIGFYGTDPIKS